ncbi:MAG: PKD domain-containing protein [Candidatus Nanoarchaeia archaeon]
MKRVILVGLILLISLFTFSLTNADIQVYNYSLQEEYAPYESIAGWINLSFKLEETPLILEYDDKSKNISLLDFLEKNNANPQCQPASCQQGWQAENGETSKLIELDRSKQLGFKIEGEQVEITGLDMQISSNFNHSLERPLEMDLFGKSWQFNRFSDVYAGKNTGCYARGNADQLLKEVRYCEKINIQRTDTLRLGVDTAGSDDKQVDMVLYNEAGEISRCQYQPGNDGCRVYAEDVYEGEYYMCVEAGDTNYQIYTETTNPCGWSQPITADFEVKNFTRDYSIFAKPAKYASADYLDIDFSEYIEAADNYIEQVYARNCSPCILPIEISGIEQNLLLEDISLVYYSDGSLSTNQIYDISSQPPNIDFSGILELERAGFNFSQPGEYDIKFLLGGEILLEEEITILEAPIIKSISPINPPAGVLVTFVAEIDYNGTIDEYKWDFGDNATQTTQENKIKHTYEDIGTYTINVEAISSNLSGKGSFQVVVGNPKDAVNYTLHYYNKRVANLENNIANLPTWYQQVVKEIISLQDVKDEIDYLRGKYESAYTNQSYIDIAISLGELDVPKSVYKSKQEDMPYQAITNKDNINPAVISEYVGGEVSAGHKDAIMRWQTENIAGQVRKEVISVVGEQKEDILYIYTLDIDNPSEESYLVINLPKYDVTFKQHNAREIASSSLLVLDEVKVEFYSGQEASFFISPKLSSLTLEGDIDVCNFNYICEPELGEDYKNCRHDCKPAGRMVFYILLIIFIGFIIYTLLQIWYKRRYELHLFRDRKSLYNLVMFVTNALQRGMQEKEIIKLLKQKKWSGEQIRYAIKKAKGERTGMYELIPVEKLFAFFRKKKVKKQQANKGIDRW